MRWFVGVRRGGISVSVAAALTAVFTAVAGAEPGRVASGGVGGDGGLGYVVPTVVGPVQVRHAAALRYSELNPDAAPPATNDFDCVPAPENPLPVVLVHGSDSDSYTDWSALAPALADRGFCVFALNYGADGKPGKYARGPMERGAGELADFVERVRGATGAPKVHLVGYSQGATVARYFVNRLGGAAVVDQWVGLASPSYGGVMYGLVPLLQRLPGATTVVEWLTSEAIAQQMQGSPFLTSLNADGDTVPGVRYTTIGSRYDEMIQPYGNVALRGPGAVDLVVQDLCPQNAGGHFNMVYDPFALGLAVRALDPTAPPPACVPVALGTGIPEMVLESNS